MFTSILSNNLIKSIAGIFGVMFWFDKRKPIISLAQMSRPWVGEGLCFIFLTHSENLCQENALVLVSFQPSIMLKWEIP